MHRNILFRSATRLVLAATLLSSAAGAQSIANAGFEVAGTGGADVFANWTEFVSGAGCTTANSGVGQGSTSSGNGANPNRALYIDAVPPTGCLAGVAQTISGLTVGTTYSFSFAARIGSTSNLENNLAVLFGGTEIFAQELSNTAYAVFTATGVATSTSAELRIQGYNRPTMTFVDNVTIAAVSTVPEPSTYALLGTGIAALGLVARARRRTV
jgi:hypothetical protein